MHLFHNLLIYIYSIEQLKNGEESFTERWKLLETVPDDVSLACVRFVFNLYHSGQFQQMTNIFLSFSPKIGIGSSYKLSQRKFLPSMLSISTL